MYNNKNNYKGEILMLNYINTIDIFHNYSAIGDTITFVLCVVFFIIVSINYNKNTHLLKTLKTGLAFLGIASIINIYFHYLLQNIKPDNIHFIYNTRNIYFLFMYAILFILNLYLMLISGYFSKKGKINIAIISIFLSIISIITIVAPFLKIGFFIDDNLIVHENYNCDFFRYAYIVSIINIIYNLYKNKGLIATKVYTCLRIGFYVHFLIMFVQSLYSETSFLNLSFIVFLMIFLYCIHPSAYDFKKGTFSVQSYESYIEEATTSKKDFAMVTLIFKSTDDFRKNNAFITDYLYFINKYFKNCVTCNLANNKISFVFFKKDTPSFEEIIESLEKYTNSVNNKIMFSLIMVDSSEKVFDACDYLKLENFIEPSMKNNTLIRCTEKDIDNFYNNKEIISELQNIEENNDLNDERVLVYCQPVYDLKSKTFKTAEALMRLKMSNGKFLFPDMFIPIAEKNGYIHTLTKIILNKVCMFIKNNPQYLIDRISINFSLDEFNDNKLVDDIKYIINKNGIPFEKIAIEITETIDVYDFENIKSKIESLKSLGIKFYLDDFGTGYSNFDKILQLPFDVIKFDRSMTIMASSSGNHKTIVDNLSKTFSSLNYNVLFEGVENEDDEKMCENMSAKLLQGYKYSKPIELEYLKDFLLVE